MAAVRQDGWTPSPPPDDDQASIVLNWDDSGAREALQHCLARERAGMRGKDIPLPDGPGLYNDAIDWNAPTYMSPEVAAAWASIDRWEATQDPGKFRPRPRQAPVHHRKTGHVADGNIPQQPYSITPTGWGEQPVGKDGWDNYGVPRNSYWGNPSGHCRPPKPSTSYWKPRLRH